MPDTEGWQKLQAVLTDHTKEHMTQGMSPRRKVEVMQLAMSKVARIEVGRGDGPLLESESRDSLWRKIAAGGVWVRNGTIYGSPVVYPEGALEKMKFDELLRLAGQFGLRRGLKDKGMGSMFGSKRQRMMLVIRRANGPALSVRDRLMHLRRAQLADVAAHLGMGRRGDAHLDKRGLVDKICRTRRWRSATREVLVSEYGRQQRLLGLQARAPKLRSELVAALEMRDDMVAYAERVSVLEGMTLEVLFDRMVKDGLAPERVRRSTKHTKLRGPVGAGAADAWLREMGVFNGKEVVKGDIVYRMMWAFNPVLTASLVDRGMVGRVAELAERNRESVEAVAERARRALCHTRCGARYHHDNEDGTWTVTSACGERMRVACGVDFDKRLARGRVEFPEVIARRVEDAKSGKRVPHRHVGFPCLLCDPRFAPVAIPAPKEVEEAVALRMRKSRAASAAWHRGGKEVFFGGCAEGSDASPGSLSMAGEVAVGSVVRCLERVERPPSRNGMWSRRAAEKACKERGVPFCSYRAWGAVRSRLGRGEKRGEAHVHARGEKCPVCKPVERRRRPSGSGAPKGGGAKRIGKVGRACRGKRKRRAAPVDEEDLVDGVGADVRGDSKEENKVIMVEEAEMADFTPHFDPGAGGGFANYAQGAWAMEQQMASLIAQGGEEGGDMWDDYSE